MQPNAAKLKLVRGWIERASHDIEAARRAAEPPPLPDVVAFHCQQATEKTLKAYLAWRDVSARKSHDLRRLVRDCIPLDPTFTRLESACDALSPYAAQVRYPDAMPVPSQEEAEQALLLAREVMVFVAQRLPFDATN